LLVLNQAKFIFMNNTSKVLVALAAGVAAGAVLAVLFAPDKGSETRRKINEQGEKLAGSIKEKFSGVKEKFNDFKEEIEQTLKEEAGKFV